jgi:hypothetical protein
MPARTGGLNSAALTSPLKGEEGSNSHFFKREEASISPFFRGGKGANPLPFKGRVGVGMGYHRNLTK